MAMYTYDIDAQAMFDDRTVQFAKFGVPLEDIERVRATVTDMWADAPGGWVYEWSRLGEQYAAGGDHRMASLVYGCAKFPCLTDEARQRALQRQLEQFHLAAEDFPVHFERRIIVVPYRGGTVEVPVHLYSTETDLATRPMLVLSGGVDTWKMDVHPWCVAFTMNAGVDVLAFDHPGTGETPVPLDRHADEMIRGITEHARGIGDGRVAHFGVSFGGNFAAMSGLAGNVDAAVDLGGPVVDSFRPEHLTSCPSACTTSWATPCTGTTPRHWPSSAPGWNSCRGGISSIGRQLRDAGCQRRRRRLHPAVRHPGLRGSTQHRGAPHRRHGPRCDVQGARGGADDDRLAASTVRH